MTQAGTTSEIVHMQDLFETASEDELQMLSRQDLSVVDDATLGRVVRRQKLLKVCLSLTIPPWLQRDVLATRM